MDVVDEDQQAGKLLAALDDAESVRPSVASTCSGRANGSQAE